MHALVGPPLRLIHIKFIGLLLILLQGGENGECPMIQQDFQHTQEPIAAPLPCNTPALGKWMLGKAGRG